VRFGCHAGLSGYWFGIFHFSRHDQRHFHSEPCPFLDDGRINEDELRRMVNWLIEKGVSGFTERQHRRVHRLSFEERKRVIQIVVEEIGAGCPSSPARRVESDHDLDACRTYADLGCIAVSITGPITTRSARRASNTSSRTGEALADRYPALQHSAVFNEISVPVLTRLALDCPGIVGVKDSSRDFPRSSTRFKPSSRSGRISRASSAARKFSSALVMGAMGDDRVERRRAEAIIKLYNEFLAGNWEGAKRIQFKLLDLIGALLNGTNFRKASARECRCAGSRWARRGNCCRPRNSPTSRISREDRVSSGGLRLCGGGERLSAVGGYGDRASPRRSGGTGQRRKHRRERHRAGSHETIPRAEGFMNSMKAPQLALGWLKSRF